MLPVLTTATLSGAVNLAGGVVLVLGPTYGGSPGENPVPVLGWATAASLDVTFLRGGLQTCLVVAVAGWRGCSSHRRLSVALHLLEAFGCSWFVLSRFV